MDLIQILVVLAIMGILLAFSAVGVGKAMLNAKLNETESDLSIMVSDLEVAVNEIGLFSPLDTAETDGDKLDKYEKYLGYLAQDYMHCKFVNRTLPDETTGETSVPAEDQIQLLPSGFVVKTDKADPFGVNYRMVYKETPEGLRFFAFISGGPNSIIDTPELDTWDSTQWEKYDDILCIVLVKENTIDRGITFDKFM